MQKIPLLLSFLTFQYLVFWEPINLGKRVNTDAYDKKPITADLPDVVGEAAVLGVLEEALLAGRVERPPLHAGHVRRPAERPEDVAVQRRPGAGRAGVHEAVVGGGRGGAVAAVEDVPVLVQPVWK